MKRVAILLTGIASAIASCAASAFMFADGTTAQCIAHGQVVQEKIAALGDPAVAKRTALTSRAGDGWQIVWNQERLKALPPELRDFLFFHECAHARVPTDVELEANCAGLIDMRAAGRAGPEFEARFQKQVDMRHAYWIDTFECANEHRRRATSSRPAG
jgi:hypothetical protein